MVYKSYTLDLLTPCIGIYITQTCCSNGLTTIEPSNIW